VESDAIGRVIGFCTVSSKRVQSFVLVNKFSPGVGGMVMVLDHASTGQMPVRSARREGMKDIVAAMNASVGFCA
jgi:hypothetical protein